MSQRQRPGTPYVYRLVRDASGQSETFGVLLLLGITVAGTTGIVVYGSGALDEIDQSSKVTRAEHSMTLFDSRSAMVALGEAEMQTIDFASTGDGSYQVKEDSGWIRISHYNHSGKNNTEVIYNETMGALVYENGDTELAYQGGGVWKKTPNTAQMISPPEFHYRAATLTFPVVRVQGDGHAVGSTSGTVRQVGETRRVYPNTSVELAGPNRTGAPYNETLNGAGDFAPYANPVQNGSVNVTVRSEYYEAWADYFRERSTTTVTVWDHNNTVTIELETLGELGDFEMPQEGNSVTAAGMGEGHVTNDFTVTLTAEKNQFKNMHWSIWAEEGQQQFEIHVHSTANCNDIQAGNDPLEVSMYYYNGSGPTQQEWQNYSVDASTDMVENVKCWDGGKQGSVEMNFTSDTVMFEYRNIDLTGSDNKWEFGPEIDNGKSPRGEIQQSVTFDQHDADTGTTYTKGDGDTASSDYLVNHYFAELAPNFDLKIKNGPANKDPIAIDNSTGRLAYGSTDGKFLTFLHVTENEVKVEIGSSDS